MFLIDWLIDCQSWARTAQVISLYNVGPDIFRQNYRLCFCGLWANIAQVIIFLCNVSQARSRVDFIGCFPAKRWYFALGQYCKSNFLVECCLRHIYTTSARWYSYAMLGASRTTQYRVFTYHHMMAEKYQGNIERDFFLCNVVWSLKGNTTWATKVFPVNVVSGNTTLGTILDIAHIKTLCSIVLETPDSNAQENILFDFVLILSGDSAQVKTNYIINSNVALEAPEERLQTTLQMKNHVKYCLNTHVSREMS